MDVLIVGGGPAGMMCALQAAQNGADVHIIEKNEKTGKKLYITGKGRCNLTNHTDFSGFIENVVRNEKFLYSAMRVFDPESCMHFFEDLGLPLKIERGNRVFPYSDKSVDVLKTLNRELERRHVCVHLNETVLSILSGNQTIMSVTTDKNVYHPKIVVICTGGITYPATGSTGDGYVFAQSIGHSIIDPKPSLCGLIVGNAIGQSAQIPYRTLSKVQGLALKNVSVRVVDDNNRTIKEQFGEMLFTHNGISGPTVLTLSAYTNRLDYSKLRLIIDLKPALSDFALDQRLLRDFSEAKNKHIKNALDQLLPKSLIPNVILLSGIPENKPIHAITKDERAILVKTIKNLTFSLIGTESPETAIITSGGVSVKEIDPKTMHSKIISNLYFAGEVLDVDALTGGFNLQIAFATAYVAGKHISEKMLKGE